MTLQSQKFTFENPQYRAKYAPNGIEFSRGIEVTIDGAKCTIPLDEGNAHYRQLMELVDAGEITIEAVNPFVPA